MAITQKQYDVIEIKLKVLRKELRTLLEELDEAQMVVDYNESRIEEIKEQIKQLKVIKSKKRGGMRK